MRHRQQVCPVPCQQPPCRPGPPLSSAPGVWGSPTRGRTLRGVNGSWPPPAPDQGVMPPASLQFGGCGDHWPPKAFIPASDLALSFLKVGLGRDHADPGRPSARGLQGYGLRRARGADATHVLRGRGPGRCRYRIFPCRGPSASTKVRPKTGAALATGRLIHGTIRDEFNTPPGFARP